MGVWKEKKLGHKSVVLRGGFIMKAINIDWDIDSESDIDFLPNEIEIPNGMIDEDEISDYITNKTGFCHYGFELVD